VAAFLKGEIAFTDIWQVVERTMDETAHRNPESIEEVLTIDAQARDVAQRKLIHQLTR
jgi:1-deoxy-D-xylulose-5-phosphate reductoisomerase